MDFYKALSVQISFFLTFTHLQELEIAQKTNISASRT